MIRVKIPQGLMDAHQARVFADVGERWSRGYGHITTRQNLQFHFVPLAVVPELLDHLQSAGLTTREACGNSVRNITTSPYAGVHADEAFDVTPYGEALTRYFLGHPLSSQAAAQVQDRLRGLRRRSHLRGHQRHRLVRARSRTASAASASPSPAAPRR